MKNILISSLLFISLEVNAQIDTVAVKLDSVVLKKIELPDSTAIGTPDGKLVSKVIGPAGGTIVSEDQRVELIFPEGALTSITNISIQPVTNMLNGSGKAYQMEPSGTQFNQPVKMIFHYSDEEAETCPPDLKSFALQDHKGKWTSFDYDDWDSTKRTLTGFIHHFTSLVTDQNDVLLKPAKSEIGVNDQVIVWVFHKDLIDTGASKGQNEFPELAGDKYGVYVNGERGGSRLVGKGEAVDVGVPIVKYNAPAFLPSKNPVEIKFTFQYYSRKKRKVVWGSSKCNVTVYDEYTIEINTKGGFALMCDAQISDKASFGIRIFPNRKPEFTEIQNEEPTLKKQADCGKDSKFKYDVAGCVGPVNVNTGLLTGYGLSYSSLNPAPEFTVEFSPAMVKIAKATGKLYPEMIKEGPVYNTTDVTVGNKIKFKADGTNHKSRSVDEFCECEVTITVIPVIHTN